LGRRRRGILLRIRIVITSVDRLRCVVIVTGRLRRVRRIVRLRGRITLVAVIVLGLLGLRGIPHHVVRRGLRRIAVSLRRRRRRRGVVRLHVIIVVVIVVVARGRFRFDFLRRRWLLVRLRRRLFRTRTSLRRCDR
jgi:hypothetical protein